MVFIGMQTMLGGVYYYGQHLGCTHQCCCPPGLVWQAVQPLLKHSQPVQQNNMRKKFKNSASCRCANCDCATWPLLWSRCWLLGLASIFVVVVQGGLAVMPTKPWGSKPVLCQTAFNNFSSDVQASSSMSTWYTFGPRVACGLKLCETMTYFTLGKADCVAAKLPTPSNNDNTQGDCVWLETRSMFWSSSLQRASGTRLRLCNSLTSSCIDTCVCPRPLHPNLGAHKCVGPGR